MAQFIMMMALHYHLSLQPAFRPSLELVRDHEMVIEYHEGTEMRPPDGAVLDYKIHF